MSVYYHHKAIHLTVCILVGLVALAYRYIAAWVRAHPVLGTIVLTVVGVWAIRQFARWVKESFDDPFTRIKPNKDE